MGTFMRSLQQSTIAVAGLWLLIALVATFAEPFWTSVTVSLLTWIFLCVAWNIVGGFAGQVSFGHAAFFGIGAYTSTYLASVYGLSPWIGMLVGAAISTAAGLLIGYLPFRWGLSVLVFALFTLALSYALEYGVSGIEWLGGTTGLFAPVSDPGIVAMRFSDPLPFLIIIGALATVLLMVADRLRRGPSGLYWRAVHDNEAAAASAGIDVFRVKMTALALSAFFTACAGTFHAQNVSFVDPISVFGLEVTVYILLFAVVGGSGTFWGPIVGPLVLFPLGELLRVQLGHAGGGIHHLVFGLALVLAIVAWPGGIMSALRRFNIGQDTLLQPATIPDVGLDVIALKPLPPGTPLLEVRDVSKDFGGVAALKNVSGTIRAGQIVGVIGPNGAGKTTLFSILSGFIPPSSGHVAFRGEIINGLAPHVICRKGVARTFQTTQSFPTLTAQEVIYLVALAQNTPEEAARITSGVLRDLGLWDRKGIVSANLTLAEHRRLEIARALATKPTIVLLDEIMAGLTPREVEEAMGLIRRIRDQGITVVVIEHHVRAVMGLSDHVIVLDAGEAIATGTPAEVTSNPRVLEAYLGVSNNTARETADAAEPRA